MILFIEKIDNMNRKTALVICSLFALFLFILLYYIFNLSLESYMPARIDVINNISNQMKGVIPLSDIAGFFHGRVWHIFAAFVKNVLEFDTPEKALGLLQGLFYSIMIVLLPFLLSQLNLSNSIIFVTCLCLIVFGFPVFYTKADGACGGFIASVLSIPLLCALFKKEYFEKQDWHKVWAVVLISALCNIPRQQSSFPVFVVLMGAFLYQFFLRMKNRDYTKGIGVILLSILAFILINKSDELLYSLYKLCGGKIVLNFVEKPWHSVYIGLGYLTNDYGIVYTDTCAWEYALSVNPNVAYASEGYFKILQEKIIDMLKNDTGFVLESYVAKFAGCFFVLLRHCLGWIVTAVLGMISVAKKCKAVNNQKASFYIISAIVLIFGTVQGVLAIPTYTYIYPAIGAFVLMQAVCSADAIDILIKETKNN